MEAKELRISNWVNYLDLPIQVDGIDDVDVFNTETGEIPLHCIFPIPLNEEWLLKFGLSKQNEYPYKFNKGYLKIRNGVFFFKYHDIEVEVQFVHQLQNLYFALTGEELKNENYDTKRKSKRIN